MYAYQELSQKEAIESMGAWPYVFAQMSAARAASELGLKPQPKVIFVKKVAFSPSLLGTAGVHHNHQEVHGFAYPTLYKDRVFITASSDQKDIVGTVAHEVRHLAQNTASGYVTKEADSERFADDFSKRFWEERGEPGEISSRNWGKAFGPGFAAQMREEIASFRKAWGN